MNFIKRTNKIEKIVDGLISTYETRNPFELASKLNIQISVIDFEDDLLAFSLITKN